VGSSPYRPLVGSFALYVFLNKSGDHSQAPFLTTTLGNKELFEDG